jgi:hypothetical protein
MEEQQQSQELPVSPGPHYVPGTDPTASLPLEGKTFYRSGRWGTGNSYTVNP